MTTVIAIQHHDGVEMIADSQINSTGKPYFHGDMVKIVERNRYLIGVAGRVVALQAIQNAWNPPTIAANFKGNLYNFVITKIVPSLKMFIDESKMFSDKEKEEGELFSIILAIRGEVFEIDEDYSVARREDGMYAIGSGADFALGALMAGASAESAMQIAASLDVNTHDPFIALYQER
jgi:ATP-dependent protease HslVU (ClpYQ) peptidase subunit